MQSDAGSFHHVGLVSWRKVPRSRLYGSSFRGSISATYSELVRVFGAPWPGTDDKKVKAYWSLEVNGQVASIYDWKRYGEKPQQVTEWNIGGKGDGELLVECINYILRNSKPIVRGASGRRTVADARRSRYSELSRRY